MKGQAAPLERRKGAPRDHAECGRQSWVLAMQQGSQSQGQTGSDRAFSSCRARIEHGLDLPQDCIELHLSMKAPVLLFFRIIDRAPGGPWKSGVEGMREAAVQPKIPRRFRFGKKIGSPIEGPDRLYSPCGDRQRTVFGLLFRRASNAAANLTDFRRRPCVVQNCIRLLHQDAHIVEQ